MFKTRKRKIASMVIAIALAGVLILPVGVWAASVAGHFEIFLTNGTATTATLKERAPRDITVTGAEKYIESIEIIHKKNGPLTDKDNSQELVSITNIDVVTKDHLHAQSIRIQVLNEDQFVIATKHVTPYLVEDNTKKFQFGLASLPNSFDLRIEVHWNSTPSGSSSLKETMTFAVPEGSSNIFKISESFTYKTAGVAYSLYDLLDDPGLFTDLLVEHRLSEIKMNYLKTN